MVNFKPKTATEDLPGSIISQAASGNSRATNVKARGRFAAILGQLHSDFLNSGQVDSELQC